MKRVVVTGGSGFVGLHVMDCLRERNIGVVVFDRYTVPLHREDITFILGDVRDRAAIFQIVENSDGVIHLAAILGTQETINRPIPLVDVNIKGSINVFDACRTFKKKAVYIAVGNHWMNNPYSITKTMAERFALMYNKEFNTKIAVVRGLNAYGPRQKEKPVRKIIPNLVIPALKGEEIIIYGSGNQIMDMIYVKDLAEILVKALVDDHNIYDEIIEAGMGKDTTINYLAELVVRMTNSESKIIHLPMRPGEIPDSIVKANMETLEKLGFNISSLTPLPEGVQKTIEWYKSQLKETS
jgi:nucleoside-diphosphate-sugar epimerase